MPGKIDADGRFSLFAVNALAAMLMVNAAILQRISRGGANRQAKKPPEGGFFDVNDCGN